MKKVTTRESPKSII